jgi:hypothetical protein
LIVLLKKKRFNSNVLKDVGKLVLISLTLQRLMEQDYLKKSLADISRN